MWSSRLASAAMVVMMLCAPLTDSLASALVEVERWRVCAEPVLAFLEPVAECVAEFGVDRDLTDLLPLADDAQDAFAGGEAHVFDVERDGLGERSGVLAQLTRGSRWGAGGEGEVWSWARGLGGVAERPWAGRRATCRGWPARGRGREGAAAGGAALAFELAFATARAFPGAGGLQAP
jgi:hypothetical protein